MPIYEYKCDECESKFEALRSMKDADITIECIKCASSHTRRVASTCFSKVDGGSPAASRSSCGGCSGGSCSSCGH